MDATTVYSTSTGDRRPRYADADFDGMVLRAGLPEMQFLVDQKQIVLGDDVIDVTHMIVDGSSEKIIELRVNCSDDDTELNYDVVIYADRAVVTMQKYVWHEDRPGWSDCDEREFDVLNDFILYVRGTILAAYRIRSRVS